MSNMTLILIEDNDEETQSCKNAVNDFNDDHKNKGWCIRLVTHTNIEAASKELESSYFDGAIIDMKLADSGDEGNQALDVIRQHLKRIPVAIYTGTPDVADNSDDIPLIDVFKKGDATYEQLIYKFWDIYNTGLTKIMGGKGQIEKSLSQIFIKHLFLKFQRNPKVQERGIGFLMQKKIQITRKKPYCAIRLIISFMNYIKTVKIATLMKCIYIYQA